MENQSKEDFWERINGYNSTFEDEIFDFEIVFAKREFSIYSLHFIDCTFIKSIKFTNCDFEGDVRFEGCIFENSIHFENCKFKSHLTLHDVTSKCIYFHSGEFYFTVIRPKDVNLIQVEGGVFINKLWVTDETLKNERILKNLTLSFDRVTGNIGVDLIKTERILLSGINKSNISFSDIVAKEFKIWHFFNAGFLTIDWWKREMIDSSLVIKNSNLKNVEITNSDLSMLKRMDISASNLTELSLINCSLKHEIYEDENLELIDAKRNSKDAFRQLKVAMSKQGDKVNELKFYSLEMNTYFGMLFWSKNFWTKLILWFDKITSDFGQDLKRALTWLFGLHLFLYILLIEISNFNGLAITIVNAEWKYLWLAIGDYLNLIIPTHKFIDNVGGGAEIIDFLMRFFSSIFIYNVIRVTRRFAKGKS